MTTHRSFESATERTPVDRGHHRFRAALDLVDNGRQARTLLPVAARSDLAEFLYVRAGDETSPAADAHDRLNCGIFLEFLDACNDSFRDSRAQGIHRRIVDCDDSDIAIPARNATRIPGT